MTYPTLEQYNQALQSPQYVLKDPELKQGQVKKTGYGLPLALCGGFALTYAIDVGGKKFALRCFHKESRDLEHRYQAISAHLDYLKSPYFLPFYFNPHGISIQGHTYPVVKMAWAKGKTLAEFLEDEHGNSLALQRLRRALNRLSYDLEQNHVAHGDIQPENVIVNHDGSAIQLIDYDGMYVDALKDSRATEIGQVNFQHPQRTADHFNAKLDRFSFLTLDVALQVLIASPSVWTLSKSEPNAVVFRRNDFLDPGSSRIFQEAFQLPNVKHAVANLAKVALGPFDAIPSLSDFLQDRNIHAISIDGRSGASRRASYLGAYTVCHAKDYDSVYQQLENRIELIGKIYETKSSMTKLGKKCVFVNFSDWRENSVKLAIWEDGLKNIRPEIPDENWIGEWVSVTGMINQYIPKKTSRYTHLYITITKKGEIQRLTEEEARFRLGEERVGPKKISRPLNSDVLKTMASRIAPHISPSSAPVQSKTRNQQISEKMRKQVVIKATVASIPTTSSTPHPASPSLPPLAPVQQTIGCAKNNQFAMKCIYLLLSVLSLIVFLIFF